jgi:hypothetical protein
MMDITRFALLSILTPTMIFAILSGSEEYGGGIHGMIQNSPNAWPWVAMIFIVLLSRKWQKLTAFLITAAGLFLLWFFNAGPNFNPLVLAITGLIPFMGLMQLWTVYNK